MSKRQLLELSAKAYGLEGYTYVNHPFYEGMERRNFEENGFEIQTQTWNPLVDASDLYHLMRKLEILVHFGDQYAERQGVLLLWPIDVKDDVYAIVTIAAEVGRNCDG